MKILILLIPAMLAFSGLRSQEYKVYTAQTDSFSQALVKVLQCAATRFKECRGDSIRRTWAGTDYALKINFPGSTMAVVLARDWDANVYVEFRGYRDKKDRDEGIRKIVAKIKHALAGRVNDPHEKEMAEKPIVFYGLSLKDANGFFSMNMELFGSTTTAPVYVLKPEVDDRSRPEEHFVLLKIYPGVPDYHYYIRPVAPPDMKLHKVFQLLTKAAITDFDSIKKSRTDTSLKKRKKADTLHVEGNTVIMNYRGGNHFAELVFPAAADSIAFKKQWLYYQQVMQAALGTDYVYHISTLGEHPYILYYGVGNDKAMRLTLQLEKEYSKPPTIRIRISSNVSHPTKAGLDADDFDW